MGRCCSSIGLFRGATGALADIGSLSAPASDAHPRRGSPPCSIPSCSYIAKLHRRRLSVVPWISDLPGTIPTPRDLGSWSRPTQAKAACPAGSEMAPKFELSAVGSSCTKAVSLYTLLKLVLAYSADEAHHAGALSYQVVCHHGTASTPSPLPKRPQALRAWAFRERAVE
jgi:hypothetical protein